MQERSTFPPIYHVSMHYGWYGYLTEHRITICGVDSRFNSGSDILRTGLVTIVMENEIFGLQSNGLLLQEIADWSV